MDKRCKIAFGPEIITEVFIVCVNTVKKGLPIASPQKYFGIESQMFKYLKFLNYKLVAFKFIH